MDAKNFRIERANMSDKEEVVRLYSDAYMPWDPYVKATKFPYFNVFPYFVDFLLENGTSLVLRPEACDHIAGFALGEVVENDQKTARQKGTEMMDRSLLTESNHIGERLFAPAFATVRDFAKSRNIARIYVAGPLCVAPEFRNRRLARLMVKEQIKVSLERKCRAFVVPTTSLLSQKIFESMQFYTIFEVAYLDVMHDGEPVFDKDLLGIHTHMKMYVKLLDVD